MRRIGNTPLAFPSFHGATRLLVLVNLATFFAFLLINAVRADVANWLFAHGVFVPQFFLHGWIWQPLTYSFVQVGLMSTLLALMSLWFLAGFLEDFHGSSWVLSLYATAVLGTAAAALLIYFASQLLGFALPNIPLTGSFGGIFGMLAVIGLLYGETEFMMFPLPINIKAKYLALVYILVAIAMMFGELRLYAFAQLGGAVAGWLFLRLMPRRGMAFLFSERWYGMRNRYYRWKRRRAARKFEVYMRSQGRTVKFDGQGRLIDEDRDDRSRWN